MINRRKLLGMGTGAAAGIYGGAVWGRTGTDDPLPEVKRYVTLGRTDLTVSEISFGSASSSDPDLVRHALDRGINFFDTAESYRWGNSEEAIGEALQGKRDQVVIASKTKAGARDRQTEMMEALEGSLRRLRTDHVDIYFNHAVNSVDRMRNEEWRAFTERARQQGKIRFRGMSGHGSRLAACLNHTIDQDLADVVLVAYNFGQDPDFYDQLRHTFHFVAMQPELPAALDRAKEKDIGVIAMKTLMGARLNDIKAFERGGRSFAQAALRWVLSSPRVDAALISMTSNGLIDEYVTAAMDAVPREHGLPILARYAYMQDTKYCRHGCNFCGDACPDGVEIAEVLRTRMYDVDYGNPTLARHDYAALGEGASTCLTCTHQACLNACAYGLPIPEFTRDAATRLG